MAIFPELSLFVYAAGFIKSPFKEDCMGYHAKNKKVAGYRSWSSGNSSEQYVKLSMCMLQPKHHLRCVSVSLHFWCPRNHC